MRTSNYKSFYELPIPVNERAVSDLRGICMPTGCILMHQPVFSLLKVGNKIDILRNMMNTARGLCL